jgi:cholest-4-en-3-one 26-monooxygenase
MLDQRTDDINLTTPMFFATGNPHEIFARKRREAPIHWTEGALSRGFWSVFGHADCRTIVLNDNRVFSLQRFGAVLPINAELEDPETNYFIHLLRSGAQLSCMDGQPHTDLRKLFADRFAVPGVASLEQLVRDSTRAIFSSVLETGRCDFTVQMAGRLPLMVIGAMMDIPAADAETLYRFNNMMAAPEDPEWSVGTALETATAGTMGLMNYLTDLAKARRAAPGTDLISAIACAELDGALLPDEHLGFNGIMFFAAGHETTRAALSGALLELIHNPAQLERMRAQRFDAKAMLVAAEEAVRWATPVAHTLRTATEDFQLGDTLIREGDWVVPWFASANRDETVFADPDRFDTERSPNPHLGFATGKHFCLGAHLARLEMRVMFEFVLEYMDEIALDGDVAMAASNQFSGVKHLPIRFMTRRGAEIASLRH